MNSMFKTTDFLPKHSEFKRFFETQIPSRLRGDDNSYLYYARLTNYYQTYDLQRTNFIPSDVKTPSEVLLTDTFFDEFRGKPKELL